MNDRLRQLASPSLRGALLRYRVLAFIVGVGLVVLVFVGIPLQVWAHDKSVVAVVGPIHGFLYIVYLVATLDLFRRVRMRLLMLACMVGAGLIPIMAFVVEAWVNRTLRPEVEAREAAAAAAAAGAPSGMPTGT